MVWDDARARSALRTLFDAAVAAADPRRVLAAHLPPKPQGRCVVVGCGKSAAVMAAALEDAWPDVALEGTVVTRYGHAVPDQADRGDRGLASRSRRQQRTRRSPAARSACAASTPDDLVLALMSGGGSALLRRARAGPDAGRQAGDQPRPAGVGRDDLRDELRAQTPLGDQGRQAGRRRPPARVMTLAISDVPGDDPAVIGSGPTVPDPTTFADARAIIARYGI